MIRGVLGAACLAILLSGSSGARSVVQDKSPNKNEDRLDYYDKWLNQDVELIITEDEQKVFLSLTTPGEKEQFIEQFWYRRDPDPRTPTNEFKEEHYRRIAYANERFSIGQPGWMSDRGRIYIMHGPPDQIESRPAGGQYARKSWEGGGWTQAYPFEVWRYRDIEGIGSDVELEFVDKRLSGQYELALNPEEKDALLQVGRTGATLAEILRLQTKGDRPYFSAGDRGTSFQRPKDNPFERYATYAKVQRPVPIKFQDLKEIVKVNVSYQDLIFRIREDYFKLDERQILVPVTLEVDHKELTFKESGGTHSADVAVYGIVTSLTNRIIEEFEEELETSYDGASLQQGLKERSIYQKMLLLDGKMRYKLDIVVKDINSGRLGVRRHLLAPPAFDSSRISSSSLVLSGFIQPLDVVPDNHMFVLGDVRVRPSVHNVFSASRPVGAYLQLYNVAVDQATSVPSLRVLCKIERDDKTIVELLDESGESIHLYSDGRVALIRDLPIKGLEPGGYQLKLSVEDRIAGQSVTLEENFRLVEELRR